MFRHNFCIALNATFNGWINTDAGNGYISFLRRLCYFPVFDIFRKIWKSLKIINNIYCSVSPNSTSIPLHNHTAYPKVGKLPLNPFENLIQGGRLCYVNKWKWMEIKQYVRSDGTFDV